MVKIRLRRMGKRHYPIYKIVAADSRSPRDGRFIESLGTYNPNLDPIEVKLNEERVIHWLKVGAQPTDTVRSLLKHEGVTFKVHLLKKGESEDSVGTKVKEFLDSRAEKLQRARDKKIRRKANKKAKSAEGETPKTEPKAEAPAEPEVETAPSAEAES